MKPNHPPLPQISNCFIRPQHLPPESKQPFWSCHAFLPLHPARPSLSQASRGLQQIDVPLLLQSLFYLNKAVNYDGHTLPLLSIQVTELLDGVFIACSFNHSIGDGTSFWNFFNMWSEIFQTPPSDGDGIISISRPPILERWFPDGIGPIVNFPFTHPDQYINRFEAPELRKRIFHFSAKSIADLKAKPNAEWDAKEISSFQSLSALVWRAITRARLIPRDQSTSCIYDGSK